MSKRILVVEDQPDNRQIIRDMLAPTDYEITEVEDGEQALAAIAKQRPDLILMDIQLPIMDVIQPRAALNLIQRCARSRSSLSLLTRLAAKRRRRGRLAVMTTCRNLSVRVNCWRKFANSCNSGKPQLLQRAMSAFGTKRTCRRAQPMSAFGGVKRTLPKRLPMSAFDPKRTSACRICCAAQQRRSASSMW